MNGAQVDLADVASFFADIQRHLDVADRPVAIAGEGNGLVALADRSATAKAAVAVGDRDFTTEIGEVVNALANRKNAHLLDEAVVNGDDVAAKPLGLHPDVVRISSDVLLIGGRGPTAGAVALPAAHILLQAHASEVGGDHAAQAAHL